MSEHLQPPDYRLPICHSCKCPASDHACVKSFDVDRGTATVIYGSCNACPCTGYRIHVANPRMHAKVDGFHSTVIDPKELL